MEKSETVFSVTNHILSQLNQERQYSSGKAMLAKLRQSIGKPQENTMEVWELLFEHLPTSFLGTGSHMSAEESAILTALQLYALHQQGRSESVLEGYSTDFQDYHHNFGSSLCKLRSQFEDSKAVDRRFNAMITATTFEEFSNHLRHLIVLLKSKSPETKVDYAELANDLYWFYRGYEKNIRLNWTRAYYRQQAKGENTNE